ncbi:hypothetical protein BGX27_003691, partial [Mortierella sp. AM989]
TLFRHSERHYNSQDSNNHDSNHDDNDDDDDDDNSSSSSTQNTIGLDSGKACFKKEISMPKFSEYYGYTCEQDAREAFSNTLFLSEVPKSFRAALKKRYEEWRRNEGAAYWASKAVDYKIEVSTKKTAGDLVDRGQYVAGKLLQKLPRGDYKGLASYHSCMFIEDYVTLITGTTSTWTKQWKF